MPESVSSYLFLVVSVLLKSQSTHRVAIADFWRTSHHNGKISPGWLGWGPCAHPPPSQPNTITYKVAVYAPAERADTLYVYTLPLFHLYPTCTLW